MPSSCALLCRFAVGARFCCYGNMYTYGHFLTSQLVSVGSSFFSCSDSGPVWISERVFMGWNWWMFFLSLNCRCQSTEGNLIDAMLLPLFQFSNASTGDESLYLLHFTFARAKQDIYWSRPSVCMCVFLALHSARYNWGMVEGAF